MPRRRYLSTEISIDPRVNVLAANCGDFAALLFTWLIPYADDHGIIPDDPEKIRLMVIPGRIDRTASDVANAMNAMLDMGLLEWNANLKLRFPPASFYRHQSYLTGSRRTTDGCAENAAKRRIALILPQSAASFSFPFSSSLSVSSSTSTDLSSADAKDGTPSAPAARKRASKKQPSESAIPVPDCLNGQDWGTPLALAVLYNQESAHECPCVVTLDPERQRKATRALALYPDIEWWIEAFRETRQSRLLRGLVKSPGHENFRGDFDWFLQGGKHDRILNAVKAFEGKYRDGR